RMLPSVTHDASKTDKWWQWTAVNSEGAMAISYYDRRYGNDEVTGFSDISLTTGNHTARVTSSSMPPPTQFSNGAGHSLFLGDYAAVTVSKDTALPIWADTRDVGITSCPADVRKLCSFGNDQDVFTARMPIEKGNGDDGGDNGGDGG
ncbi:MAG TPA: hypothetical protein VGR34_04740, partial [Candidatus Dormibacteraeota bacterium]|nr:hypothetical protein [Candidatus Dormibacteraeota bacterium]